VLRWLGILGLATAAIVAGCSRLWPTAEVPPVVGVTVCAGVGLDAFLHGDPADPRTAWVVRPDGARQDVLFPAGYAAVFAPTLEIHDPDGRVAMVEGDYVYGACVGPGDHLTVSPGESLTLDCGPIAADTCRNNAPSIAATQPGRANAEVASLRFTSPDGEYVITYDDGATIVGTADLGG
jgi:hypothetical protein